jgi:membrane associated rhomboid family serine protease
MFFIIPVGVDYTARRYPVVTFILIGLNTLLYVIHLFVGWLGGPESPGRFLHALGLVPAEAAWYNYFTTLFTHVGFWHLLGNMVYLFLFGACVEDLIGRWQYVVFYLLGGLAADLAHIVASAGQFTSLVPLVGASGAISACLGGFVLLLAKTRINFRYVVFLVVRFWSGDFWLPAWLVLSFWFLEDLISAMLSLKDEAASGGVACAAHVGGFIAGLGMIALHKAFERRRQVAEAAARSALAKVKRAVPFRLPETPAIHIYDNGVQVGPFTLTQVNEMLVLGSISGEAQYWREGMIAWRSVIELPPESG